MKLLLDTHALLWWLGDQRRLKGEARKAIASADNDVVISVASGWEIAIKRALGKLDAPADLAGALKVSGIRPLAIQLEHVLAAGALPRHHEDPFDRLIIAHATAEQATVVTHDKRFDPYGVAILWV